MINSLKNILKANSDIKIIKHGDKFPSKIKKCCLHPDLKNNFICNDIYTPWERGKEWLYSETIKYQPKIAEILMSGSNFFVTSRKKNIGNITGYNLDLYQEIKKKEILIYRDMQGYNPSDDGYNDRIVRANERLTKRNNKPTLLEERHLSLPMSIQKAYYYRFNGFQFPTNHSAPDISMGILPAPTFSWYSIDQFLGALRLKKKYLPWFDERFPGIKPKNKDDDNYTNFMCFLDTRTDNPRIGDVFFVKTHIQDGIIYHIKDADIDNMRILSEPSLAIDLYCKHVLLGNEGKFDFMPYT